MLTAAQVEEVFDDLLDYVPRLRTLHAQLRSLYRETRIDGRKTNFLSPLGGGSGVSDPTADAVERRNGPQSDVPASALRGFLTAVNDMRRAASIAESAAMRAFPPPPAPDEPNKDWCRSCLRADVFVPVYRGSFCRFCYDWQLANDLIPPVALLVLRDQGRKITTKLVAELAPQVSVHSADLH